MDIGNFQKDRWVGIRFAASPMGKELDFTSLPTFTSIGIITKVGDFKKAAEIIDDIIGLLGLDGEVMSFVQVGRNLRKRYGTHRLHAFFVVHSTLPDDQDPSSLKEQLQTFKLWLSNQGAYVVTIVYQPEMCKALIESEKIIWLDDN